MADMNTKKTALQLLVMNGILTEQEAAKCIAVLKEAMMDGRVIYEDDAIIVSFKSLKKVGSVEKSYSRKASIFEIGLDLYNKSDEAFEVIVYEMYFNGYPVPTEQRICIVPAGEKRDGTFSVRVGDYGLITDEKLPMSVKGIEYVEFDLFVDYGDRHFWTEDMRITSDLF